MSEENKAQSDFVKALGEMSNPPKNRTVNVPGKYKFDYADLAVILDTVRPILAKNGLAVSQPVSFKDGKILVTTKIRHVSGVVVEEATLDGKDPGTPQQQGSLISYLRRYQLVSILGITADDDDDANAAQDQPAHHQPRQQAAPVRQPEERSEPTKKPEAPTGKPFPRQSDKPELIDAVRTEINALNLGQDAARLARVATILRATCTRLDSGKLASVPAEQVDRDALIAAIREIK